MYPLNLLTPIAILLRETPISISLSATVRILAGRYLGSAHDLTCPSTLGWGRMEILSEP